MFKNYKGANSAYLEYICEQMKMLSLFSDRKEVHYDTAIQR